MSVRPIIRTAAVASTGVIEHAQSGKCLDGGVSQGVRLNDGDTGTSRQWR
ncbi:hypothetical protein [Streptomyces sp. NPDC006997]